MVGRDNVVREEVLSDSNGFNSLISDTQNYDYYLRGIFINLRTKHFNLNRQFLLNLLLIVLCFKDGFHLYVFQ